MVTMLITIEDYNKVDIVKKFASNNDITINWEKDMSTGLWIEVNGTSSNVNNLYDMVVKFNRMKNSNFFNRMIIFLFY